MNLLFRNFWNTLRRYKVASVLNILGLSIAFAAFAVLMIQVNYTAGHDKFHSKYNRIYRIETFDTDENNFYGYLERPMLETLASRVPGVEALGTFETGESMYFATNPGSGVYNAVEWVCQITSPFLDVFDFEISAGDIANFRTTESILISESQSARLFPGIDPIGRYIKAQGSDSLNYQIVAVYKDFPDNSILKNDIYVNLGNTDINSKFAGSYNAYVLVAEGVSIEEVSSQAETVYREFWGIEDPAETLRLSSLSEVIFSKDVKYDYVDKSNKTVTYALFFIAFLIVIIASINFVNFSTALVPVRIKNINTQKILGGDQKQIRITLLFESILTSLLAGIGAVLIIHVISLTGLTHHMQADLAVSHNLWMIGFMLSVSLVAGLAAGIYPAYYITSFPPALVLKGSFGLSPRGRNLRTVLISVQYVVSLSLIIVALFVHQQNRFLEDFPIGFDKDNVLVARVSHDLYKKGNSFTDELLKHPDINNVAFSNGMVVAPAFGMRGGIKYKDYDNIVLSTLFVSESFIETLGLQLAEGRDFLPLDSEKRLTFIPNQTAQRAFDLEVGDELRMWGTNVPMVGIVKDFNFQPLHYPVQTMSLVLNGGELPLGDWELTAYFRVNPVRVTETIEYIRGVMVDMGTISGENIHIGFLDEAIGNIYKQEGNFSILITVFSLLAILISLIGVFGLVLFETQYRRKEIGIRKVHGAGITDILALLNKGFVRIVLLCFIISVPVSYYAIVKWLEGFAYKSVIHIWIFAVSLLTVLVITMLTVTLQSYRAATENPVNSIKTE